MKDRFLAGMFLQLREKVESKFPNTFEEAMMVARDKDRKIRYQALKTYPQVYQASSSLHPSTAAAPM